MDYWIHDGFLDSRWVLGFTIGSWIHDRFLDSGLVLGFKVQIMGRNEGRLKCGPELLGCTAVGCMTLLEGDSKDPKPAK